LDFPKGEIQWFPPPFGSFQSSFLPHQKLFRARSAMTTSLLIQLSILRPQLNLSATLHSGSLLCRLLFQWTLWTPSSGFVSYITGCSFSVCIATSSLFTPPSVKCPRLPHFYTGELIQFADFKCCLYWLTNAHFPHSQA
jgi:hypothetical protein